jgi:large subunit ribosomal protein L23
MIQYIKSSVIKPSTLRFIEDDEYFFDVHPKTTKQEVKNWIQNFFSVKVINIRSYQPATHMKRREMKTGYKARYKRMIVKIQSGQFLPVI